LKIWNFPRNPCGSGSVELAFGVRDISSAFKHRKNWLLQINVQLRIYVRLIEWKDTDTYKGLCAFGDIFPMKRNKKRHINKRVGCFWIILLWCHEITSSSYFRKTLGRPITKVFLSVFFIVLLSYIFVIFLFLLFVDESRN